MANMKNLKHSGSAGSPGSPGNPKRPKPSKKEMKKMLEGGELYKIGGPRLLQGKESPLSKFIKKLVPKKSGAGYSGD